MNKVLVALLTGVAVGMLIAPDKGTRTREKLMDGFNDLADRLSDIKEQLTPDNTYDEQGYSPATMSSQV